MDYSSPEYDPVIRERHSVARPRSISSGSRRSDNASPAGATYENCRLRKDAALLDNCSKSRFISMIALDLLLSGEMQLPGRQIECMMLRCRAPFEDIGSMMRHLLKCDRFSEGEFWCYSCDRAEKFSTADREHCSWNRKGTGSRIKALLRKCSRSKSPSHVGYPATRNNLDEENDLLGYKTGEKEFNVTAVDLTDDLNTYGGISKVYESGLEPVAKMSESSLEPLENLHSLPPIVAKRQPYQPQAILRQVNGCISSSNDIAEPQSLSHYSIDGTNQYYECPERRLSELPGNSRFGANVLEPNHQSQSSESTELSPFMTGSQPERSPLVDLHRRDIGSTPQPIFDVNFTSSPTDADISEPPPWEYSSESTQWARANSSGSSEVFPAHRRLTESSRCSDQDVGHNLSNFHMETDKTVSPHTSGRSTMNDITPEYFRQDRDCRIDQNAGRTTSTFHAAQPLHPEGMDIDFSPQFSNQVNGKRQADPQAREMTSQSQLPSPDMSPNLAYCSGESTALLLPQGSHQIRASVEMRQEPGFTDAEKQANQFPCPFPGCTWRPRGKRKNFGNYLRKHMATHQGNEYPCNSCGKAYNRKDNLQSHKKDKHPLSLDVSGPPRAGNPRRATRDEGWTRGQAMKRHRRSSPGVLGAENGTAAHQTSG